jgi:hypothetical protein
VPSLPTQQHLLLPRPQPSGCKGGAKKWWMDSLELLLGKMECQICRFPYLLLPPIFSSIVHTACRELLQLVSLLVPTHQSISLYIFLKIYLLLLIDFADLLVLVHIEEFL